MFRITRNAIADHYRSIAAASKTLESVARESESINTATDSESLPTASDGQTDGNGLAGCMRFLIAQLPHHYEEAIELVELDGLSQKEAAERTGISLSGMKSRVQRGRSQLRGVLLSCCTVELDGRQRVMDYEAANCGCDDCC